MAYGLEIRDTTGAIVFSSENSDVILNEETISVSTVTATGGGGSVDVTIEDVQDSNKIAYGLFPDTVTSGISTSTSTNTLTISNTGSGDVIFDVFVFRLA
jgi:hypothetical protein